MDTHLDHGPDLLREHVEGVRRLAHHLVRDPEDAEDLAQESLLAAVHRRPPGVRNLRAWLRGVVRKQALQMHRAEGRRARHTRRLPPRSDVTETDSVAAGLDVQRRLVAAVEALPDAYRTVVWFRYFEGVSAREIGARLDEPVETVRTRLKRALQRLRTDLDARHDGRRAAWTSALAPLLAPGKSALLSPAALLAGGLALAIVAGVAVVVGLTRPEDPQPDAAPSPHAAAPRRPGPAEETSPAQLRGRANGDAAAIETSRVAPTPRGTRVHGQVLTQDRTPIAGARVSVVEGGGLVPRHSPKWRILGQAIADARGRYEAVLDVLRQPEPGEPLVVLIVAEAPGFRRGRQVVELEAPRTAIDSHLGTGRRMEGAVVDERGVPVPDLPVRVATLDSPPHMVWGALLWTERKRLTTEGGGYLEQRARTDASGYFVVQGLEPGRRYGVLSEDLAWFLRQDELVLLESGREPAPFALVAVPARAVRGTLTDAATGEPLAKGLVALGLRTPDGDGMSSNTSVRDGRFLAGWDLDEEQRGGLEVEVTASAAGYVSARVEGRLSPEAPVLDLEIALEPIREESGTVLLSVVDSRGAPLPGRVWVWARRHGDDGVRLPRHPEPERPGGFRFELPAGAYSGSVSPRHVLGSYARAEFEVTVRPDEVSSVRVEVGAGATLRLRLPLVDEMPAPSGLSISPVGEHTHRIAGGSTDLTQDEEQVLAGEDLVWGGFVPGTWRLELQWGEERLERTVHLADGDDQLVSFR